MANRPAPALVLRAGDRDELERWTRASTVPAAAAKRARIVLLAADGVANTRIAELVDSTVTTVLSWRNRYQAKGLAGLADAPRPGRPRRLDHRQIVAETLKPPPKKLGVTHWSSRLLADRLGISNTSVARAWRSYGVKPWKAESFRFSKPHGWANSGDALLRRRRDAVETSRPRVVRRQQLQNLGVRHSQRNRIQPKDRSCM